MTEKDTVVAFLKCSNNDQKIGFLRGLIQRLAEVSSDTVDYPTIQNKEHLTLLVRDVHAIILLLDNGFPKQPLENQEPGNI